MPVIFVYQVKDQTGSILVPHQDRPDSSTSPRPQLKTILVIFWRENAVLQLKLREVPRTQKVLQHLHYQCEYSSGLCYDKGWYTTQLGHPAPTSSHCVHVYALASPGQACLHPPATSSNVTHMEGGGQTTTGRSYKGGGQMPHSLALGQLSGAGGPKAHSELLDAVWDLSPWAARSQQLEGCWQQWGTGSQGHAVSPPTAGLLQRNWVAIWDPKDQQWSQKRMLVINSFSDKDQRFPKPLHGRVSLCFSWQLPHMRTQRTGNGNREWQ